MGKQNEQSCQAYAMTFEFSKQISWPVSLSPRGCHKRHMNINSRLIMMKCIKSNKFIKLQSLQQSLLNKLHQMRALMKGNAAQFFKKKQKVVEDPEIIMNLIQARVIAKYIGIDEEQIKQFAGFFEQVNKIKLPKQYRRYLGSDKNTIFYVNELTGDQQSTHPSIDIIKVAFYKMLQDENAIYTFNVKSNKLLPFVEEKMIKQCIGLSSKRREAQKTNLQRDQNGKIVMSKLARLKPDLRPLINSRSYMLKALVQKIYTKKEIWGRGKKANIYAAIIANEKGANKLNIENDEQNQQSEQQLQLYQQIYTESKHYYQKQYGHLQFIPQQLKLTKPYYKSTPQSVLRNLGILNIQKNRMELYWLARLMECLPLPPGWSTKTGDTFDRFFYEPTKMIFDLHPSYIYVLEQMNLFKQAYLQMDTIYQNYYNNMKQMTFFDFFQRPYSVDLFAFVQKVSEMPVTKKKALKKSEQLGKNDWMVLEGIKNSEMKAEQYPLIDQILKYWSSINCREDNYVPAISPFGQIVWSSNINERTINFCPHSNLLKMTIEQKSLDLPTVRPDDLKQFDDTRDSESRQLIFKVLPQQRQRFLQHYIRYDPVPLSPAYKLPKNFKQSEYYDSNFISPFNLQADLKLQASEQVPLWLQKVHAKRKTDNFNNMLNRNIDKFQQIKQEVSNYTLDMIKRHQPNRQQDIIKVLSQIKSVKQLKKFILHINDIDSREQRKRLAAIGLAEEEEDSFGSSISQIQMEEEAEEEEQSEDELIQIQVQKSEEENEKAESGSQSQDDVDLESSENKRIQQLSAQSDLSQKQPEKYQGIIYQKDKDIQKLSTFELDEKLKSLKKQKILKHKYSKTGIKDMVQRLSAQLLSQQIESKQLMDRKRNSLISRFNSEHAPFKISPSKISHKNNKLSTPMNIRDVSQQFAPFKSQTSVLGNDEINSQMREMQQYIRYKKSQQENEQQQKKVIDDTKQTIELQPIKRIKPDINQDPRLTHISQLFALKQFSKSFNPETKSVKSKPQQINKMKSTKNILQQTSSSSKFNPENSTFSTNSNKKIDQNSKFDNLYTLKEKSAEEKKMRQDKNKIDYNDSTVLQKSQSVLSISNSSISPTKFNSKFNRVCLGNTASSLLGTEPILRQTDLAIIEARKSLVFKGRGLETFISKKY